VCIDIGHSAACVAGLSGWAAVVDRSCPPESGCAAGYCTPPHNAQPCAGSRDCPGDRVCDLFVVGGRLVGYCAPPFMEADGPGAECGPPGPNTACQSGICGAVGADGSQAQCLSPCSSDSSCPESAGTCRAFAQPGAIEGLPTSALTFCSAG
jgi:hypothetical protein